MKRLLTYLFLVTVLIFSISTKANALFSSKGKCVEIINNGTIVEEKVMSVNHKLNNDKYYCERGKNNIFIDKKKNKDLFKKVRKEFSRPGSCKRNYTDYNANNKKQCQWGGRTFKIDKIVELKRLYEEKTQITKKEPTQTQRIEKACITPSGESKFKINVNDWYASTCRSPNLIVNIEYPSQFANLKKYAGTIIDTKTLLNSINGTEFYKIVAANNKKNLTQTLQVAKKEKDNANGYKEFEKTYSEGGLVKYKVFYKANCAKHGSFEAYNANKELQAEIIGTFKDCKFLNVLNKNAEIRFTNKKITAISVFKMDVTQLYGSGKRIGVEVKNHKSKKGVIIVDVLDNKPAMKAGLKKGDIIISINGVRTETSNEIIENIIFSKEEKLLFEYVPKEFVSINEDSLNFKEKDRRTIYIKPELVNEKAALRIVSLPEKGYFYEAIFYEKNPWAGRLGPDFKIINKKTNKKAWEERQKILESEFNDLYSYYNKFKGLKSSNIPKHNFNAGYYVVSNLDKKEKKKVVKVVEQEQEEFKPKKKDIDNDPPVIQIAEAITVDSQAYTLKGKVKDKSKQIYLTIDGRPVEVKRGKFTLDRFNFDPEIVEEIKIVAIDKWNNKSEKIVKVTVKLKATEVAKVYEELKPNKVKVSKDKNKIAIIIGVEKYKNMTECNYCNRDAKAFKVYATRALGVIPSNIISLIGSKATRGEILRAFKISLPRIAGDGGKDINVFFAGHGLASESGEDLYIIPQDGDQSLLEDTAISRVELIKLIKKVNPKSVTMFFDTCYSGQTRGEQMLVASLRGIRIVEAGGIPDNFTIFTASSSNQGSSHIEEVKQGIFSYYLMKGLEGKADGNKDKQITNGELIAYLKTNVSKEAFSQAREQDPMLSGDPNQVLMKY